MPVKLNIKKYLIGILFLAIVLVIGQQIIYWKNVSMGTFAGAPVYYACEIEGVDSPVYVTGVIHDDGLSATGIDVHGNAVPLEGGWGPILAGEYNGEYSTGIKSCQKLTRKEFSRMAPETIPVRLTAAIDRSTQKILYYRTMGSQENIDAVGQYFDLNGQQMFEGTVPQDTEHIYYKGVLPREFPDWFNKDIIF